MGNSHTHVDHQDDDTNGNDTIVEIANQSEESDDEVVGRYVPPLIWTRKFCKDSSNVIQL